MIDYTLSDKLKIQYQTAKPFPYIVIDNFLPDFLLKSCLEEIKKHKKWFSNEEEWVEEFEKNKLYYPTHSTDMVVLGGNMRLKAMREAGWKDVPIHVVDWDEDKQRQFIIKDNLSGGEWDWEMLANQWDELELQEWGLDVWKAPAEVDYSILDEDDLSDQIDGMASNVMKAIQIEFEPEHYEQAFELVKFWRQQKLYIGGFLMERLKEEREKL